MIVNRLSEILHTTGMTQADLARALDIRPSTINTYTRNKITKYDMRIVDKICRYFGISSSQFFYDDDEQYTESTE